VSQPHSILLVEDDLAHAEITRRNLEEFHDQVRELIHVPDGQAALDYLRGFNLPSLILLDLRLPRIGGLEVLQHVKQDSRLKCIPVIVLTTSKADSDLRTAYERGANAYLVKPVEFDAFIQLTRTVATFWLQCNRYVHA
jgi:two-component system response regulator